MIIKVRQTDCQLYRIINVWSKYFDETRLNDYIGYIKFCKAITKMDAMHIHELSNVNLIFDKVGMSEIWINQNPINSTWLSLTGQFT